MMNNDMIIQLYNQGFTSNEIAKKLNCSRSTVNLARRNANITFINRSRRTKVQNENFFDIIDSEEKAYFLGLLLADGCISDNSTKGHNTWGIQLSLAEKDKELIYAFAKAIKSTNKICKVAHKSHNVIKYAYKIAFSSKHMASVLINKYKILPRKLGKEIWPDEIPDAFISHFIRGIFDGDGGIASSISRNTIYFCTGLNVIQNINKIFNNIGKIYTHQNTYLLMFNHKFFIPQFYNYIYNNATIFLKRKKMIFEEKIKFIMNNCK